MVAKREFRHFDPVFAVVPRQRKIIGIADAGELGLQAADQAFQGHAGEAQEPHRLRTSPTLQETELATPAEAFEMIDQSGIRIAHDRIGPGSATPCSRRIFRILATDMAAASSLSVRLMP